MEMTKYKKMNQYVMSAQQAVGLAVSSLSVSRGSSVRRQEMRWNNFRLHHTFIDRVKLLTYSDRRDGSSHTNIPVAHLQLAGGATDLVTTPLIAYQAALCVHHA
jgi:hypothetical protein